MYSRPIQTSYDDLDAQLAALGERLDWSATPDLSSMVVESLGAPAALPAPHRRRLWLAAAAIAILLLGALLAGSSSVRTSIADFLGIDGLRIEFGEPETTPTSLPTLGTPTSAQDFEFWLPFTPMQPASLDEPDAVYLRILENGDAIGLMVWKPSESLPQTAETGLGVLLMQFDPPEELVMMLKTVGLSEGSVTDTFVNGNRAYWVEGASELTIFDAHSAETRPSGNVLIWEQNGIGFRLESALAMDKAIAIAESMQPIGNERLLLWHPRRLHTTTHLIDVSGSIPSNSRQPRSNSHDSYSLGSHPRS
jgi:hypothetical protein